MTPQQFIDTWQKAELTERSACQQHFLGLCELLGEKKPAEVDPTGAWFTVEKGLTTTEGKKGFADVWRRGFFGWEYKGKHKDLKAAYQQLLKYREALLNPPLLVVCDLDRFEVHTNFPNTVKQVHAFDLAGLADPKNRQLLKDVFTRPEALKPGTTQEQVTADIARRFARLADRMRLRNVPPDAAAHFLMKLMFCMFAEDIDLLPRGLFTEAVRASRADPARLATLLADLFARMAAGGFFGPHEVARFNGGLFADAAVVPLEPDEIAELLACAECDWAQVEPSVFGTLFERCLDPAKRSQLGAHYTGRADIETLLGPVLRDPLRREWDAARAKADALWEKAKGLKAGGKAWKDARLDWERAVNDFRHRLTEVTVLDPACGSGNFLYVALNVLLDLEKDVLTYAAGKDAQQRIPYVRPSQLRGIERNVYAQELAQVVIWIGFLQWMKFNGFVEPSDPVLDAMDNIACRDAVLDLSDPADPKEPAWPDAEFVVGNPPFLGGNKVRAELGDGYVTALFRTYEERVPAFADLCCYWFEKARAMIEAGRTKRAGLLATQGIRGGANRSVLDRIKQTGDIYFGLSDADWVQDGATVHISMVGFDDASETTRMLDGEAVPAINSSLSSGTDVTGARRLVASLGKCFMGASKKASFDVPEAEALDWLNAPNPHAKPNSDVVRPWANGIEVTRRPQRIWIVDFGNEMLEGEAALYEKPFDYVTRVVRPERVGKREGRLEARWWRFGRPRVEMRQAIGGLARFLVTPAVAKHRTFSWVQDIVVPDQQLLVFADPSDWFFGVLHSRVHEVWARAPGMGTQVRERESGFRYTPTTCFETFPFPEPSDAQREAIAAAAKELDSLRTNWLNPPEWTRTEVLTFPGSADGPWRRYVSDVDPARNVGTVRYPRTVAKDADSAARLKKRTLTNLYNESPAWLKAAHARLDAAVFAAYGWPPNLSDDDLLARLLELNLARAAAADPGGEEAES